MSLVLYWNDSGGLVIPIPEVFESVNIPRVCCSTSRSWENVTSATTVSLFYDLGSLEFNLF